MEKIQVKLCAGTMCYIMGDAQLTKVSEKLTDKAKYMSYMTWIKRQTKKTPFVAINGELIENVNKEILLQIIKDKIRNAVR